MKEPIIVMPPVMPFTHAIAEAVVRCACCQRVCSIEAWRALPTMVTLTASEVKGYVSVWPADVVVEVRACGGCGRAIARRRARRAPEVSAA